MRLFRRQGYASTGLQQILEQSGAPKGSLYHYFPNGKEALGEAAVELAGGMVREMLTELAARHADPKAYLAAYCKVMAGWMQESHFRSGCPVATTMLETAATAWPRSVRARRAAARSAPRSVAGSGAAAVGESGATRAPARWSRRSSNASRSPAANRTR